MCKKFTKNVAPFLRIIFVLLKVNTKKYINFNFICFLQIGAIGFIVLGSGECEKWALKKENESEIDELFPLNTDKSEK